MSLQKDRRQLTQEGLLIAISTCLWRISRNNEHSCANTPGYKYIAIANDILATRIYEIVTELFKAYNTVLPDGLYVLSA